MAILTDIPEIFSASPEDFMHIVDVSDTTQDPAGSSFKITVGALLGTAGIITGSGTLNKFPIFTPDGSTLGDSNLEQVAGAVRVTGNNRFEVVDLNAGAYLTGNALSLNVTESQPIGYVDFYGAAKDTFRLVNGIFGGNQFELHNLTTGQNLISVLNTGETSFFADVTAPNFLGDGSQLTGLLLDQLEDVDAPSPSLEDFLVYNDVSGNWEAQPSGRAKWRKNWVTGTQYLTDDMVYDQGWLMIANKSTAERAAPQPIGEPTFVFGDTPAWSNAQNTSVVYTGHLYTFNQAGWAQELRVWIPELSNDTNYRFVLIKNPNSPNPETTFIEEPVLQENAWTTLALGSTVVAAGTELLFYIDALNSGSSTPTTGGWNYSGADNNNPPPAQGWNRNTQSTIIRISTTDLDSSNRETELLGITAGSTIRFSDSLDANIFDEYTVNADPTLSGGAVIFGSVSLVARQGTLTSGQASDMDASTPIQQSTKYVEFPSYFPAGYPEWGTVEGFKQFNGVDQPANENTGFGVDIRFQPASVSEDWDIMSYVGGLSGGSGGGGGAASLGELNDVTLTGVANNNLLYYDGNTSQWINSDAKAFLDLNNVAYTDVDNQFSVGQTFNSLSRFKDTTPKKIELQSELAVGQVYMDFLNDSGASKGSFGYTGGSEDFLMYNGVGDSVIRSDGGDIKLSISGGTNALITNTEISLNTDTTVNGDLKLDTSDARIRLKGGVTGTNSGIDWTFNTDTTKFASIDLDYDLRASQGLLVDSDYPITLDFTTNLAMRASGGATWFNIDASGNTTISGALFAKDLRFEDWVIYEIGTTPNKTLSLAKLGVADYLTIGPNGDTTINGGLTAITTGSTFIDAIRNNATGEGRVVIGAQTNENIIYSRNSVAGTGAKDFSLTLGTTEIQRWTTGSTSINGILNVDLGVSTGNRKLNIGGSGAMFTTTAPAIRLNNTTSGRFGIIEIDDTNNLNIWASGQTAPAEGKINLYNSSGSGTLIASFGTTHSLIGNTTINGKLNIEPTSGTDGIIIEPAVINSNSIKMVFGGEGMIIKQEIQASLGGYQLSASNGSGSFTTRYIYTENSLNHAFSGSGTFSDGVTAALFTGSGAQLTDIPFAALDAEDVAAGIQATIDIDVDLGTDPAGFDVEDKTTARLELELTQDIAFTLVNTSNLLTLQLVVKNMSPNNDITIAGITIKGRDVTGNGLNINTGLNALEFVTNNRDWFIEMSKVNGIFYVTGSRVA